MSLATLVLLSLQHLLGFGVSAVEVFQQLLCLGKVDAVALELFPDGFGARVGLVVQVLQQSALLSQFLNLLLADRVVQRGLLLEHGDLELGLVELLALLCRLRCLRLQLTHLLRKSIPLLLDLLNNSGMLLVKLLEAQLVLLSHLLLLHFGLFIQPCANLLLRKHSKCFQKRCHLVVENVRVIAVLLLQLGHLFVDALQSRHHVRHLLA